jgi:transposase
LDRRIKELDKTIGQRLMSHPQARIICSLPGMGPLLAAELLVAVGDLGSFPDAGHLAAYAGLAPVPRDSGRRTGNLHPPQRYHRRLRRVLYLSALSSLSVPGPNRDYYRRKRAQGRKHQQALVALARRRVDVLWALLRDSRCFELAAPVKTTTTA